MERANGGRQKVSWPLNQGCFWESCTKGARIGIRVPGIRHLIFLWAHPYPRLGLSPEVKLQICSWLRSMYSWVPFNLNVENLNSWLIEKKIIEKIWGPVQVSCVSKAIFTLTGIPRKTFSLFSKKTPIVYEFWSKLLPCRQLKLSKNLYIGHLVD